MSDWRSPKARLELTSLGAGVLGIISVVALPLGLVAAFSLWPSTSDTLVGRIFVAVWMIAWVGCCLNTIRIAVRRRARVRISPWINPNLSTPLFSIRPIEDRG
ncbi:hypothetical protein [Kineosporia sp. NBRC 101731]|uniref:hypothetical protein n=1 Tax=Kineosporia sp. NBRC 101731 TaxID=3032199 RepID=UPI0024A11258|nr:hypothetical protein [Kineosporia sp. NBRC 101731]GLY28634.1 hypothetical protein Kisp02_19990 [Kineosporia sp. NBRC 101731]